MTDITLINISIGQNFKEKVVYKHNAVGILFVVGALERAGFRVSFREHLLNYQLSFQEESERFLALVDASSKSIGIGCHSVHLPFVAMVCGELKKRFPDKKIILGGVGPSAVARDLLAKFDCVDIVVMGEAEETIVDVLKNVNNLNRIDGIAYRHKNRVYLNNPRMPQQNLDSLALPAYHALDFKQYQIFVLITSRGCPFGCPFCSLSALWGRKVRYRSIDNVMEELRLLVDKYKVRHIFIGDSTFIVDRERTIELCRRFKKENLDFEWECLVRLDSMDEELMELMRESGCGGVFYGLESGSENVLKKIKQSIKIDKSLSVIKLSLKYFTTVQVGLMWGFPFETLDDFKQTLKIRRYLEEDLNCEVQLRWLEPYRCTSLYDEYKKELFFPNKLSIMFDPHVVESKIAEGRDYYLEEGRKKYGIPTDVTNIRFIIAASHTANMCRSIIEENPRIFCDYYRYRTPDLEEKLHLASQYSIY